MIEIFYIVVFASAIFLAFLSDELASGRNRGSSDVSKARRSLLAIMALSLSALILFLVRGFRYGIGIDYFYTYVTKFAQALASEPMWGDALYNGFIGLCTQVSTDYLPMFVIDSALFTLFVYLAIWLSGCSRWKAVAVFCLSYHYLRSFIFQAQYFAMALCLAGCVVAFMRRHWAVGMVSIAIAAGFHSSAVVLIPAYATCYVLFRDGERSSKMIMVLSVGLPLFSFAVRQILPNVLGVLLAGTRYAAYFGEAFSGDPFSWYLFGVNAALLVFFVLACCQADGVEQKRLVGIGAVLQSYALSLTMFTGVIPLMYRLVFYAMFFQVITIPIALESIKNTWRRQAVTIAVFLAFTMVQFFYLQPDDTDAVFQYVSVFHPEKLPAKLENYEKDALLKYQSALTGINKD